MGHLPQVLHEWEWVKFPLTTDTESDIIPPEQIRLRLGEGNLILEPDWVNKIQILLTKREFTATNQ
jgi:hypothetical protein